MSETAINILNYKYEIFPTAPQRAHLKKILRQSRIQWNKAVIIRRKLMAALRCGQVEHVVNSCLSIRKPDEQSERKKAIEKFRSAHPEFSALAPHDVGTLFDISTLLGKVIPVRAEHLDRRVLIDEISNIFSQEQAAYREARKLTRAGKEVPKSKSPLYWTLRRAINKHAGEAAKTYLDQSFECAKNIAISEVRFNISGSAESKRWNQAVNPKAGQKKFGAKGEPRTRKRSDGFAYKLPRNIEPGKLFRKKTSDQIFLSALPGSRIKPRTHDGMRWVNLAYHREIPAEGNPKQLAILEKAGRFFVVLSVEVPESAWKIDNRQQGWQAGIDPGATTALTVALKNPANGELRHLAIDYRFFEKAEDRLEKMQQTLSGKQGPRRKRIPEEVQAELDKLGAKSAFRKLGPDEQGKALEKRKAWLEKTMVKQPASKRWRQWMDRVRKLQTKIANQRADVLHKVSRALVEGCDLVALGDWDPPREVSYRKKLRAAKKKVRMGLADAQKELDDLVADRSKNEPKGAKKRRKGGRDRAIPTLRRLLEEKGKRAGIRVNSRTREAGSTYTCNECGAPTGPRGDLSVRAWRCEECNTEHNRDVNGGFNILKTAVLKFAATQAAVQGRETVSGSIAFPGVVQGATDTGGSLASAARATGPLSKEGASLDERRRDLLPPAWQDRSIGALKSLLEMGVAFSLEGAEGKKIGSLLPETGPPGPIFSGSDQTNA